MSNDIALSVKNLHITFSTEGRILQALRGISLDVYAGECLAIVGESGSGKSVLCKSCMGLLESNGRYSAGQILYRGQDLTALRERQWQHIRGGELAMVMQDPKASLNPLRTIGSQITEAFLLHGCPSRRKARENTLAMLKDAGFPDPEKAFQQYPHQLSGGMCQRVCIAMAVACRPRIIFFDEPTSSLDVTTQAQILEYISRLRRKYQLTMVFITHDLGVVAHVADRVAVIYAGDIVEIGTSEEIFFDPRHPYTWGLLASIPQLGGDALTYLSGSPPDLTQPVTGDAFAPRNPAALKIDYRYAPGYFEISPTHRAKTWLLDPRAPLMLPPESVRNLRRLTAEVASPPEGMCEHGNQ